MTRFMGGLPIDQDGHADARPREPRFQCDDEPPHGMSVHHSPFSRIGATSARRLADDGVSLPRPAARPRPEDAQLSAPQSTHRPRTGSGPAPAPAPLAAAKVLCMSSSRFNRSFSDWKTRADDRRFGFAYLAHSDLPSIAACCPPSSRSQGVPHPAAPRSRKRSHSRQHHLF